jgi:hypothetical protein
MTTHALAFIDVALSPSNSETYAIPSAPRKALAKNYHSIPLPRAPDALELDNIQWGARLDGPSREPRSATTPSGAQTPRLPHDLEMSRPASPILTGQDVVEAMQSFSNPPINRFRMLSVCLLNFCNGLSDSAPGALIPYIEKYVSRLYP